MRTTLNLDHVLGNNEGRFDTNGSNFSGSASMYGLNGTTLVARLRSADGNHHDAHIDLNSFISNRDGRLEKA
ncbi:Cyanovirin-N [Mycena latifolia]|nr:Cyanovirin-N [Mycena latifolia]